MKPTILLYLLALLLSTTSLSAQDSNLADPCGAMPKAGTTDAKYFLTFDRFDKELRAAITSQDALTLSFLVRFPLRVNDSGGTISIDNAEALKTHFQEVFTPTIRKEILAETPGEHGCMKGGIGYGLGVILVSASDLGYAIRAVNRDAAPPFPKATSKDPSIKYICQTHTHRIVVETAAGDVLSFRSWNKPKPLSDSPDLEIAKGDGTTEGTYPCVRSIYTFKNGNVTYRVGAGLGCWGDNEPGPPKDVTGSLEVTIGDKPATDTWCYY